MGCVESMCTADRDTDPVDRDGVLTGDVKEEFGRKWVGEKIFRVDLQPPHRRASGHHFRQVRKPQADASVLAVGPCRSQVMATFPSRYFGCKLPPTRTHRRLQYP
jgi:hypothetical protein